MALVGSILDAVVGVGVNDSGRVIVEAGAAGGAALASPQPVPSCPRNCFGSDALVACPRGVVEAPAAGMKPAPVPFPKKGAWPASAWRLACSIWAK